jgi:amylosucrase
VLVIANFDVNPQYLDLSTLSHTGFSAYSRLIDLYSGKKPSQHGESIVLQGYQFYWLVET